MGYAHYTGWKYILLLLVAAATDYYDGVLARKMGIETATLRQADSIADTVFFLGVFAGIWLAYPNVIYGYAPGIFAVVTLEALRYVYDLLKFKRGASYHALSAKAFGVSLLVATIAIMGFGTAYPYLPVALFIGVCSGLEGLCMSIVLPVWTYNVRHLGVAINLRNRDER